MQVDQRDADAIQIVARQVRVPQDLGLVQEGLQCCWLIGYNLQDSALVEPNRKSELKKRSSKTFLIPSRRISSSVARLGSAKLDVLDFARLLGRGRCLMSILNDFG